MTTNHHIYAVKNLLSHGASSDDFSYSNRLILHFLETSRAFLIERKADKYTYISDQSFQSWCTDLELGSYHSCCDVTSTCKGLKSVLNIPKFLNTRWGPFIKVTDLDGNVVSHTSPTSHKYSKYALNSQPKIGWYINDNHLFIVGNTDLKKVLITALWASPIEIMQANCAVNTDLTCPDLFEEEFPIDVDLIAPMYEMTLKFLSPYLLTKKDDTNDQKDGIQANTK